MAKQQYASGVRHGTVVSGVMQRGGDRKQVASAGKGRSLRRTRTSPRRPARGTGR